MLGSVSYSQTSKDSTPSDRSKLISLCEAAADEVVESRKRIADYQAALAASEKVVAISDEQIKLKDRESDLLRRAIDSERRALEAKSKEVEEYKKALAKVTKKKNFFKSIAKITTITAGVAIGILVLKQ